MACAFFGCKKVPRNHDINQAWNFHYVNEAGMKQWIPNSISPIVVTFNKKDYHAEMPVNNMTGKCDIFKNGDIEILGFNQHLLGGDSTSTHWQDLFIEHFANISTFEISADSMTLRSTTSELQFSK
ncbi:MAG: hypothetical protein ACI9J3_002887 [Parvicellaceae bacterium]|jgi:hypothetical protein